MIGYKQVKKSLEMLQLFRMYLRETSFDFDCIVAKGTLRESPFSLALSMRNYNPINPLKIGTRSPHTATMLTDTTLPCFATSPHV